MSHLVYGLPAPLGGDFVAAPTPGDEVVILPPGAGSAISLSTAEVWATDTIELMFTGEMAINADLTSTDSYAISAIDDAGATPIRVLDVRPGRGFSTTKVFLIVSKGTLGATYEVEVQSICDTYGLLMSSDNNKARFVLRRTKTDNILDARSNLYDMSSNSLYRNVMNAVLREDELLGGGGPFLQKK